MKKVILAFLLTLVMVISMIPSVSAVAVTEIYLDELTMSSYKCHNDALHPGIGVRFEAGTKPFYKDGEFTSEHTINFHEGAGADGSGNCDITWDVSAFTTAGNVAFSAGVAKTGGGTNAIYSVVADGVELATTGLITDGDGLKTLTATIPQGTKVLALRANWGNDNITHGEYTWVDAKMTLPTGVTATRMDEVDFLYTGHADKFIRNDKWEGGNGGLSAARTGYAGYWDAAKNTWGRMASKHVLSGHQQDASFTWDVSDFGAGYFTVKANNNCGDTRFYGNFAILIDGEEVAASGNKTGAEMGLWMATVEVPAEAETLVVIAGDGGDNITCGDFSIADPVFVELPAAQEEEPTNPDTPDAPTSPDTFDMGLTVALVGISAAAIVIGSKKKTR